MEEYNLSGILIDYNDPLCLSCEIPKKLSIYLMDEGYSGHSDKRHVRMVRGYLKYKLGIAIPKPLLIHEPSGFSYAKYTYKYEEVPHGVCSVLTEAAFFPWAIAPASNDKTMSYPGIDPPERPTSPAYPDKKPYLPDDNFSRVCFWQLFLKYQTFVGDRHISETRILSGHQLYVCCKTCDFIEMEKLGIPPRHWRSGISVIPYIKTYVFGNPNKDQNTWKLSEY